MAQFFFFFAFLLFFGCIFFVLYYLMVNKVLVCIQGRNFAANALMHGVISVLSCRLLGLQKNRINFANDPIDFVNFTFSFL